MCAKVTVVRIYEFSGGEIVLEQNTEHVKILGVVGESGICRGRKD